MPSAIWTLLAFPTGIAALTYLLSPYLPPEIQRALPSLLLRGSAGGSRKPYVGAYDPSTGLGRGAPGFQTNVAKVKIPPSIAARIKAGEQVSADEITEALSGEYDENKWRRKREAEKAKDDWLPPQQQTGGGGKKRR